MSSSSFYIYLQRTKDLKGVKIEDHFSDKEKLFLPLLGSTWPEKAEEALHQRRSTD